MIDCPHCNRALPQNEDWLVHSKLCRGTVKMTNEELILSLRKAASIWFRNSDLLLLEELIRRFQQPRETTDGHAADSSSNK